jgi:hypothetical protein
MVFVHPQQVCMTYFEHCRFSLKMSCYFARGCLLAIVHAFLPDRFVTSTSDTVKTVSQALETAGCRD